MAFSKLHILVAGLLLTTVLTQENNFCVPLSSTPQKANRIRHVLFSLPSPFAVSYGGYINTYPDCSIRGVQEAIGFGYLGISVSVAYLNSGEIAMTPSDLLSAYTGGFDNVPVAAINGNDFSRLSYKRIIDYGTKSYRYSEFYKSSFLFEIFESIKIYDGIYFIQPLPNFLPVSSSRDKILTGLTIRNLKYVIDAFDAWTSVIIYSSDIAKALELSSLSSCTHLYSTLYFGSSDLESIDPNAYRFNHLGIAGLRGCTEQIKNGTQYYDFSIRSGSSERLACAGLTMLSIGALTDYEMRTPAVNISQEIRDNYYEDVHNMFVGLYASPYSYDLAGYSDSILSNRIQELVSKYRLNFYISPLSYFYTP